MDSKNLEMCATLTCNQRAYTYFSLKKTEALLGSMEHLPISLKILIENILRHEKTSSAALDAARWILESFQNSPSAQDLSFMPARVLMQDFTGVPAIVDLAAMRAAVALRGGDPALVNPQIPVDLVIDHSVMVDTFGSSEAFQSNMDWEYRRNQERYQFLKWGQKSFHHFRVVPPGTGICHQVNLEFLATVVTSRSEHGETYVFPDTLVGTDSHTTMVNGMGVLGWGVGGIEAEAAMLGQPLSMTIPEVVGVVLEGQLPPGVTATDLVLTVTERLRKQRVVGKFVEFCGPGLKHLSLADRATVANMAPEYGATCGFFPVDEETLDYLRLTGRSAEHVQLVETYLKQQGMWHTSAQIPTFHETLTLDMSAIEPSLAGPKRPQDRVPLSQVSSSFVQNFPGAVSSSGEGQEIRHGDVVIAAITSCTNTSNPYVMMAAGLLARNAVQKGLRVPSWVKTSLAPGSQSVTDYLKGAGLLPYLETLGFHLVGYGCTTCIGNSGPLPQLVAHAIDTYDLTVAAVLSGNRNFEGRVHPQVKANYLASPPLVVAYALAGHVRGDLAVTPLGSTPSGEAVFLKDIWPSAQEIRTLVAAHVTSQVFATRYASVLQGEERWQSIQVTDDVTYAWDKSSTYIQEPPYFDQADKALPRDIREASILALLGDSVTTDHISPAGNIKPDSPAGRYLRERGIEIQDFNSYGARRGHHEVMVRGTLANIRLQNAMVPEKTGGWTRVWPEGTVHTIFDAALMYQQRRKPLVLMAGKEYGTGSSRDWAAKGTYLLGVKAVLAESFERIHRSNLVGMGVLPLVFPEGQNAHTLGLEGSETLTILGIETMRQPRMTLDVHIQGSQGRVLSIPCLARIDTLEELKTYHKGGILHAVAEGFL